MARVLVLYYSSHGHIEAMAGAIAEGVARGGGEAVVKRVPETAPPEMIAAKQIRTDQPAPVCTVDEMAEYDAIVIGAPTRYGRLPAQMAAFLDQTGGLWARGTLNGKVGAAFASSASQHGGQETTLFALITNMLHLGMVIVGLPYSFQGQLRIDEVSGGSPYGATTIAGAKGERQPSANELEGARHQGELVARAAAKLAA
ncbi:NAD(P)H:quinone oxidoreductase [Sphingomonas canadensis]|uniref:NAD(P)H dehydrogenase (quinone) n=1 Tax=Sphingomonas canadensis TaxID=1219257 RepID=A0ABW3HC00_9SPHN|nr:NAD(P)H:quinone oxidoreductase [Sphingomonas canadensis]MCW3838129.1 NAD(P)H:quinone oxidoreductase [Sphingomonas canadensis]